MMLKKMCFFLLCAIMLSGCSSDEVEREWAVADPLLLTFMPSTLSGYWGDGDYYHESNRIEATNDENGSWTHVFGEVKDNLKGYNKMDFRFQISYLVDSQKIIQSYEGKALNDSKFSVIELLRLPIEIGNTWQFSAEDQTGKNIKVTGEIINVSETGDHVVVKYSTKDGYYEQRDLVKGMGVTDFIRQVTYKDESTYTGYHIEKEMEITSNALEYEKERIEISEAHHDLILNFEKSWPLYVKNEDAAIFETILPESNAEQKVKSLIKIPNYELEFLQFIPYEQLIVGNVHIIYVREQFVSPSDEVVENKTMFTIIEEENQYHIIDFESIK